MADVHMPHAAEHHDDENPAVHHETSDVNVRGIFVLAVGLVVVTAFFSFLVWVLFEFLQVREATRVVPEYPLAATQETRLPPEPRLQTDPRGDLQELRTEEDRLLNSYGWVDKSTGTVRIPIEEAMRLMVQRGLPARQGNDRR
jgi:hypothetical protein